MSETLILAKVAVHELDWEIAKRYSSNLSEKLRSVDGFIGFSLWRSVADPVQHLMIYRYRDERAADEGLKAIANDKFLTEAQTIPLSPPDVVRMKAAGYDGETLEASDHSCFLSLSVRVAEPGYGVELGEELKRIFAELRLLPGYVGSIYGPHDTLDEELIGIVIWRSEAAFRSSLPDTVVYEVKLYRRII